MYDNIALLAEFSAKVLTAKNISTLSNLIIENVAKGLRPQWASFLLFELTSLDLLVEKRRGFLQKRNIPPTIEYCDEMKNCTTPYGSMFVLPGSDQARFLMFFDPEEPHSCELRLPFTLCTNYLGILSLGRKKAAREYSNKELDYLQVLTNFVTTATQNSELCPAKSLKAGKSYDSACQSIQCGKRQTIMPRILSAGREEQFGLLGDSPAMQHIRETIAQVAGEDVPVLITGESGTGKELIAHAIHIGSRRAGKPMVAMNCAALPETLIESELFGYERGAFTGANEQKKGKFEYADHSTLFLDEIGDMSLPAQAKLLRVLQDGTFYRVGGNIPCHANVRIVAATNQDLFELAMNKAFREDLYYRLNVVQIQAPPLRERGDDIFLLAEHYFSLFNRHYQKSLKGFSQEALDWLKHYDFPGNVRELKNIIERAIIMERGTVIKPSSFPQINGRHMRGITRGSTELRDLEREHILSVMQDVNFNKSEAARRLGIARKTLREKMQRYGIESAEHDHNG